MKHRKSYQIVPIGPHLEVGSNSTESGRVVTAAGDIDVASAPILQSEVEKHQGVDVIIDLTRVDFIDSAGLVVLIQQQQRIRASGAELTLAIRPGPVTRLLELTGLAGSFPTIPGDSPDSD